MSNEKNQTDTLLLQMTGTQAEIKTQLTGFAGRVEGTLDKINDRIQDFGERLIALEKDRDAMQDDIAKRTHVEETTRLRQRLEAVENGKASNLIVKWLLGVCASILVVMIAGLLRQFGAL